VARPHPAGKAASVRVIHLSDPATVALDIAMWALVHAGTGYFVHRIAADAPVLARDQWWSRPRPFEREGRLYERGFRIKRWKDRLPEAGALFPGGVSKRTLPHCDDASLRRYVIETRRAELGHWLAALASPWFVLWNPPGVAVFMVAYGTAVNLPFIVIQRYNRARIERLLGRRLVVHG
jgi:glycosyl-4,4'-diaponeurosporenoate acyltransferase